MVLDWKNAEDIENVREMERGERRMSNDKAISAVMAKLTETESLSEAFNGCRGVFHTSSFVDPAGLSGYTVSLFIFFILPKNKK